MQDKLEEFTYNLLTICLWVLVIGISIITLSALFPGATLPPEPAWWPY